MTDAGPVLLPELDSPPRGGIWRHLEDEAAPLTMADALAGNHLGSVIDPDDPRDTGIPLPRALRPGAAPSSYGAALADAQRLREALLDWGVRRVSIELQPGARGAPDPWHVRTFRRNLAHHIVSRPQSGMTPGLSLVKLGRTGASPLAGPLCNGYGGFDLTARIITLSWANHPGAGGPWTAAGTTVPTDNGRPYLFGWEFEGGILPWTDEMHVFMAQCNGATLQWLGQPLDCHGEHASWTPRKIDRLGYTATGGRLRIDRARPQKPLMEDEDMPWTADQLKRLQTEADQNHALLRARSDGKDLTMAQVLERIEANTYDLIKRVEKLEQRP